MNEIIQPSCFGQFHPLIDGIMLPVHHIHSVPTGYCELCDCKNCESIREIYFGNIKNNVENNGEKK